MNGHQITSKYNVQLYTDSLVLITNIFQENQKASITALKNISVTIPQNIMVIWQEKIHTQTEVPVYERNE